MRVLLHVHSTYSYDGESPLEEICEWGEARGLQAVFLTEHTNDFDRQKMSKFVAHCDALGDRSCRLVPGLEFPVRGGFHLLGFNVRAFDPIVDSLAAAKFIREQGGLGVLAHPARYRGAWPDDATLSMLDGIEVWNARYDGRFVPSGSVIGSCEALMKKQVHLARYCGQDLHAIQNHRLLLAEAKVTRLGDMISHLREGSATLGAAGVRFQMRGPSGLGTTVAARAIHPIYEATRALRGFFRSRAAEH